MQWKNIHGSLLDYDDYTFYKEMVKKLDSTQKSQQFFANERDESPESFWHCSVPSSWDGERSIQGWGSGVGWSIEGCRDSAGEPGHYLTASSPLTASLLEARPAWDLLCWPHRICLVKYWEICHWLLGKKHLFMTSSKCFTSTNFLFFHQINWAAVFYSSDLEYSVSPW